LQCCSFQFVKGKLAAFEEPEGWEDRLAEFNGCTGAKLEVSMHVARLGFALCSLFAENGPQCSNNMPVETRVLRLFLSSVLPFYGVPPPSRAADEDNMQEYIENDVGRGVNIIAADLPATALSAMGANIYDAYIVQAPWLPGVQKNLEDMT
jgi:hypothetical protein